MAIRGPRRPELILITGGARSGKSRYALEWARRFRKRGFLATAQALDDEMRDRIAHHQLERGRDWRTYEEPVRLAQALELAEREVDAVVVDCLTLWLSNLLVMPGGLEPGPATDELVRALQRRRAAIALVTNEVGSGIVPDQLLGRRFRDLAGSLHQRIAAIADRVVLMVAGCPLELPRPQSRTARRRRPKRSRA
jgi:adenosylcobinamide kinase/adenosylcobinamide-phosphate guanylyltransferase